MINEKTIIENINNNDEHCVGALLKLYSYQTREEQAHHYTKDQNSVGFNSADANFLSSCAQFYLEKGWLSQKQISYVRKCILKYSGQLAAVGGYEPAPIKKMNGAEAKPANAEINSNKPNKPTTSTTSKKAWELKGQIAIQFEYDPELVAKVKTLHGRWFHNETKPPYWTAELSRKNIELLETFGFDVSSLKQLIQEIQEKKQQTAQAIDSQLTGTLRPFQAEGIKFIESQNGRALIGDEMGLGKTIQAIGWMAIHPELRPAIIVCPATVKQNWAREIKKWFSKPQNVCVLKGQTSKQLPNADIYIINYDIIQYWKDALLSLDPQILVLDESHYIKNFKAIRTKVIMDKDNGMGWKIPHVICLSGTPIINRPIEFFNTIRLINPKLFPSRFKFAQEFCGARHTRFGWDFNGATNTGKLHQLLTGTIMIRRMKRDVLKDLPPKQRTVIPIEMENGTLAEYANAENNFIGWLTKEVGFDAAMKAARAEALVKIEYLKQLALKGKMSQIIPWINDFIESGEKLVVFCTHTETIDWLMKEFSSTGVRLDGSTSQQARQQAIDQFQNNPEIKLFIGNIKAAGAGITLTAASNTCFIELGWTPGEHSQAEDRVHRIGQEADSVNAWYLLAAGTIEEDIAELLDYKSNVLSSILDGQPFEEDHMLTELLNRMMARKEAKKEMTK